MHPIRSIKYRSGKLWKRLRAAYIKRTNGAEHVGTRSFGKRHFAQGYARFRKTFANNPEGLSAFQAELEARRIFGDNPWMTPILDSGEYWIDLPQFPEHSRLDRLAQELPLEVRRKVALQALQALFDIFAQGYAHRDFHAKNLFWHDEQLFLIDFECIASYPFGQRPHFEASYDIVGKGLSSPHRTGNACYTHPRTSLEELLGVPLRETLEQLKQALRAELHHASLTFKAKSRRHTCNAQRIYNSFKLPYLQVDPSEAQRRTDKRIDSFGIVRDDIVGRRVLDIGSNIGGMLFELQNFGPDACHGIEFDGEKVTVAQRVAAYNGLNNVFFHQRNIDYFGEADLEAIGGAFDVVFCLAVIEHVERRERLYELLGQATTDVLYFEGNTGTQPEEVIGRLKAAGFHEVRHLGMSNDDFLVDNRNRPIFKATKRSTTVTPK